MRRCELLLTSVYGHDQPTQIRIYKQLDLLRLLTDFRTHFAEANDVSIEGRPLTPDQGFCWDFAPSRPFPLQARARRAGHSMPAVAFLLPAVAVNDTPLAASRKRGMGPGGGHDPSFSQLYLL